MSTEPKDNDAPALRVPNPHTDDELKQFARDYAAGQLWTVQMIPPDLIRSVFMTIGLGGLANYDPNQIGTIYEHNDKAMGE